MSMPHDSTSSSEPNDKWLIDHRRDVFPNKADWTVQACNGTHIWLETDLSGCFASQDCKVSDYLIISSSICVYACVIMYMHYALYCALCIVHCTSYIVHCAMCIVHACCG